MALESPKDYFSIMIKIYLVVAILFGAAAAFYQWKRFRPRRTELLITFLINGIFFPLIVGLNVAKVLKRDKIVNIP